MTGWSWSFGDPASSDNSSTAQNPSHTFSAAGSYTVSLTAPDVEGVTSTTTNTVDVTAPPRLLRRQTRRQLLPSSRVAPARTAYSRMTAPTAMAVSWPEPEFRRRQHDDLPTTQRHPHLLTSEDPPADAQRDGSPRARAAARVRTFRPVQPRAESSRKLPVARTCLDKRQTCLNSVASASTYDKEMTPPW